MGEIIQMKEHVEALEKKINNLVREYCERNNLNIINYSMEKWCGNSVNEGTIKPLYHFGEK